MLMHFNQAPLEDILQRRESVSLLLLGWGFGGGGELQKQEGLGSVVTYIAVLMDRTTHW